MVFHSMKKNFDLPIEGTRAEILTLLLGEDYSALDLEKELGINESAIRRHLDNLEQDNYVEHRFEKADKGRPKKIFTITQKGRKLFPQKTHILLSLLAEKISDKYGKEELNTLLSEVAKEFANIIGFDEEKGTDKEQLEKLVKSLDDFGFYAALKEDNGDFHIIYRNCIFEEVIEKFGDQLCDMHRRIVSEIIPNAEVTIEKSIGKGDKKCTHHIEV